MEAKIVSDFKNKIWITRKCRINTSERLNLINLLSKLLIGYFTLVILSISIWSLGVINPSNELSFITIIASLFLFGGTIGINSLNFTERTNNLKTCYIQLDALILDSILLEKKLDTMSETEAYNYFEKIRNQYIKELESVENHSAYDYLKYQYQNKDERDWRIWSKYYFLNTLFILSIILLVSLPFIPFYWRLIY